MRITMTETTLRRMFVFDRCIDVTFERLARFIDTIDVKYTRILQHRVWERYTR